MKRKKTEDMEICEEFISEEATQEEGLRDQDQEEKVGV